MIGFDPSEEQALIVETVRQFADKEIRPLARECDEARQIPEAILAQSHELGLVANALPEEAGGGGVIVTRLHVRSPIVSRTIHDDLTPATIGAVVSR